MFWKIATAIVKREAINITEKDIQTFLLDYAARYLPSQYQDKKDDIINRLFPGLSAFVKLPIQSARTE